MQIYMLSQNDEFKDKNVYLIGFIAVNFIRQYLAAVDILTIISLLATNYKEIFIELRKL